MLTHARPDLLCRTLEGVFKQVLRDVQVIVVDNGSGEATQQLLRELFPQVHLVSLTDNSGIRGRNEGFRKAQADVVLSLDDDIELADPETLTRILRRFVDSPTLGALTLLISDVHGGDEFSAAHWWHPRSREKYQHSEFETDHINEAAVAFRRQAVLDVGGYFEELFWGGEEWDLCLALMDAGYEIRYAPEVVWHLAPRGSLDTQATPRHALLIRNRCWIALRRLPLLHALAFAVPRLAVWGIRSIRFGYFRIFLEGLAGVARIVPRAMADRKTVSRATLRRVRNLRS